MKRLLQLLRENDGKPFGQIRRIAGVHSSQGMSLCVDHVQGDPHGPPSRMSIVLEPGFHPTLFSLSVASGFQKRAAEELFLRAFAKALPQESNPCGDGPGGRLRTVQPGPYMVPRSAVHLSDKGLVLRFAYHIPAEGRRIMGRAIGEMLMERIPALALDLLRVVKESDIQRLANHLEQRHRIRMAMMAQDLVAFIPNGSLPARDAQGKPQFRTKPFQVPDNLSTELALDNGTRLRGLGIRKGVTVLVGAAFHGKTTLLEALRHAAFELGHEDGLGLACAISGTEFVTVEEDRAVAPCNLSPFFRRLPGRVPPEKFEVREASGSTSQAANVHESLASGARLLLVDEDASAANFLTRDPRIASLLPEGETVVPLVARSRELARRGVSMVVVAGASSEWLAVADQVIALSHYEPTDVTQRAREVVAQFAIAPETAEAADWDSALANVTLEAWKELGNVPATKVRVQEGVVRLGGVAEARLPRRFEEDDRLRKAGILLCDWMRHCRDRNKVPDRDGLLKFAAKAIESSNPWGEHPGHDLALPTAREIWSIWTRLVPTGTGPSED